MRMFELKIEKIGRKWMQNVEIHNLYCLSDSGVSKNSGKTGKKCGVVGSEGNLELIFDWKTERKESIQKAFVNMEG
jgi:hypothetical protein